LGRTQPVGQPGNFPEIIKNVLKAPVRFLVGFQLSFLGTTTIYNHFSPSPKISTDFESECGQLWYSPRGCLFI